MLSNSRTPTYSLQRNSQPTRTMPHKRKEICKDFIKSISPTLNAVIYTCATNIVSPYLVMIFASLSRQTGLFLRCQRFLMNCGYFSKLSLVEIWEYTDVRPRSYAILRTTAAAGFKNLLLDGVNNLVTKAGYKL